MSLCTFAPRFDFRTSSFTKAHEEVERSIEGWLLGLQTFVLHFRLFYTLLVYEFLLSDQEFIIFENEKINLESLYELSLYDPSFDSLNLN